MTVEDALQNRMFECLESDDALALRRFLGTFESKDRLGPLLVEAVSSGKLNCLAALLEMGANANYVNEDGESPMSYACARNQFGAAKLLHANGAHLNQPSNGASPLDIAVCWSSPEFRSWLRNTGATRIQDFDEWPWPPDQTRTTT